MSCEWCGLSFICHWFKFVHLVTNSVATYVYIGIRRYILIVAARSHECMYEQLVCAAIT